MTNNCNDEHNDAIVTTTSSKSSLHMASSKNDDSDTNNDKSVSVHQLLNVRGATQETNIWKIRLQFTKPVTWIPLLWGVVCGAAALGNYHCIWNPFDVNEWNVLLGIEDMLKGLTVMILA
jgi:chlorophyll/bacteriochlorophyll a synthase